MTGQPSRHLSVPVSCHDFTICCSSLLERPAYRAPAMSLLQRSHQNRISPIFFFCELDLSNSVADQRRLTSEGCVIILYSPMKFAFQFSSEILPAIIGRSPRPKPKLGRPGPRAQLAFLRPNSSNRPSPRADCLARRRRKQRKEGAARRLSTQQHRPTCNNDDDRVRPVRGSRPGHLIFSFRKLGHLIRNRPRTCLIGQ